MASIWLPDTDSLKERSTPIALMLNYNKIVKGLVVILKNHRLRLVIISIFLAVTLMWGIRNSSQAKPRSQFTPPSQITLEMYVLTADGSIDFNVPGGNPACYSVAANRTRYGCTFFEGDINKPYPFTADTITIGMEDHQHNNIQQGYLHNVISQEMAEGSLVASYVAQAIAARTYAYYQSDGGTTTINNSGAGGGGLAAYQVYLPFRYDGLGEGLGATIKAQRQATVNQAVTEPGSLYMTLPTNDEPIVAFFGADNCTYTEDNAPPAYLGSIYDPISQKPDPCNNGDWGTPNGGMGSAGASRWGYGNTSEYGTGNDWNMQWQSGLQILTHYYTGIQIRNGNGNIITPEYRWNPLVVTWNNPASPMVPPPMTPNAFYLANMRWQNTGSIDWPSTRLAYEWQDADGVTVGSWHGVSTSLLPKGDTSWHTVNAIQVFAPSTPGVYTLIIDMQVNNGGTYEFFFDREFGRPWYPLVYTCEVGGGECTFGGEIRNGGDIFLPIILKNF